LNLYEFSNHSAVHQKIPPERFNQLGGMEKIWRYAIKPLEEILKPDESQLLRKFQIPSGEYKIELRRFLSEVGLDAYSIYGGPDALGKSMVSRLYTLSGNFNHSPSNLSTEKENSPPPH
jgi:hypothetical protein